MTLTQPGPAAGGGTGLDRASRRVAGRVPLSAVHDTFGLRLVEASAGNAVVCADVSSWLIGVGGLTAAGAAAVVADSALGSAALTTVGANVATTTIQLRLDHLVPIDATTTTLRARATVDGSARDTLLVHGEVVDDLGRPVTRASARCLTVPGHGEQLEPPDVRGRRVRDSGGDVALAAWTEAGRALFGRSGAPAGVGPPLVDWLSMTTARDDRGDLVVSVPAWPWLANSFGGLMGGSIALVAEQSLTLAATAAAPAGTAVRPVDLQVVYLRPVVADGATLGCATRVVRCGRRVIDVVADLVDARGRLVATARAACLLTRAEQPQARPVGSGPIGTERDLGKARPNAARIEATYELRGD